MTKDFKSQMKESQRKHEEEKQNLQKEMARERRNFKDQRKIIEKEVSESIYEQEMSSLWLKGDHR